MLTRRFQLHSVSAIHSLDRRVGFQFWLQAAGVEVHEFAPGSQNAAFVQHLQLGGQRLGRGEDIEVMDFLRDLGAGARELDGRLFLAIRADLCPGGEIDVIPERSLFFFAFGRFPGFLGLYGLFFLAKFHFSSLSR